MLKSLYLLCVDRSLFTAERKLKSESFSSLLHLKVSVFDLSFVDSIVDTEHITGLSTYVELQMRISVWS